MRRLFLLMLAFPLTVLACQGESSEDNQAADNSPKKDMAQMDMRQAAAADLPSAQKDLSSLAKDMSIGGDPDVSGSPDLGRADLGPSPVPVLLALGDFGRTTISCDGGQSWVADTNFEEKGHKLVCGKVQSSRCYDDQKGCERTAGDGSCEMQKSCDCDHHPATPMGIAWGGGWFVATFGWGAPGVVARSRDGVTWEEVQEGKTHARVLYGQDTFVLGSTSMDRSGDQGVTWMKQDTYLKAKDSAGHSIIHPRQAAFIEEHGGRFVFIMESGVPNMPGVTATAALVSGDQGVTWAQPDQWPEETCGKQAKGAVAGRGVLVITHASGAICVSDDGAKTFSVIDTQIKDGISQPVFDGTRFHIWSRKAHHTSLDGVTWADVPLTGTQSDIGAVAFDPVTRSFAAVRGGWQNWYEKQRFLHSADGTTWQELEESQAKRSHRIRHIAFGWAPPGFVCPDR